MGSFDPQQQWARGLKAQKLGGHEDAASRTPGRHASACPLCAGDLALTFVRIQQLAGHQAFVCVLRRCLIST